MIGLAWVARDGRHIVLAQLPWPAARLIAHLLDHPRCTPDAVLLLADALAELRTECGDHHRAALADTERDLRAVAPTFGA